MCETKYEYERLVNNEKQSKSNTPEHSEQWRDVPDFEGIYQVSSLGRVKSMPRMIERRNGRIYTQKGRVLKGSKNNGVSVKLYAGDGTSRAVRVARLVYLAFIGQIPDGFWVLHKDGNEDNCEFQNLCLGDGAASERMKAERNGGTHPLVNISRVTDVFWNSKNNSERRFWVS